MIGLCTENYLVPDCCDQSPDEGCGVGPAPSRYEPCTIKVWPLPCATPRLQLQQLSAPVKHQVRVPKVGAVLGSLGQVICPCSFVPAVSRKAPRSGHATCRQLQPVQQRSHPELVSSVCPQLHPPDTAPGWMFP